MEPQIPNNRIENTNNQNNHEELTLSNVEKEKLRQLRHKSFSGLSKEEKIEMENLVSKESLMVLHNKPAVYYCLQELKIANRHKWDKNFQPLLDEDKQSPHYTPETINAKIQFLEKVLRGEFPTESDLHKPTPWPSRYPLCGDIAYWIGQGGRGNIEYFIFEEKPELRNAPEDQIFQAIDDYLVKKEKINLNTFDTKK